MPTEQLTAPAASETGCAGTERINWVKALTLSERAQIFNEKLQSPDGGGSSNDRILSWKSQPPFDQDEWFERRLAADGLTEEKLECLIELADKEQLDAASIAWGECLVWAERALSRATDPSIIDHYKSESHEFLVLIHPLLDDLQKTLSDKFASAGVASTVDLDPDEIARQFCRPARERLYGWLQRVCILEVNVARLEKRLPGNDAEERFNAFLAQCCEPVFRLRLFSEYPVLLRAIAEFCFQWRGACCQTVEHLLSDYELLGKVLNDGRPMGRLTSIEPLQGDPHHGSKTVTILRFDSGFACVYKPHSLSVDVAFQHLLNWCNERDPRFAFKTLRILDRGSYGWVEFVDPEECHCQSEAAKFYWRQGAFTALFYALAATDMHFENLIACADQPVFVDLETLFHSGTESSSYEHADLPLPLQLPGCVVATGLLPTLAWGNAEQAGVDLSGLGGAEGQLLPAEELKIVDEATDRIRIELGVEYTTPARNLPKLDGKAVVARNFLGSLVSGFDDMYDFLLDNKQACLAADGPLHAFASAQVRRILRPTRLYMMLFREGFHPDYLRDAWRRDQLFDHLWLMVPNKPWLARVIDKERKDLWRSDMPHFTAEVASQDLHCGDERTVPRFFSESAQALVERRIGRFSEEDRLTQRWTMEASLSLLRVPNQSAAIGMRGGDQMARAGSLEGHAVSIAERLSEIAVERDGCAFWPGTELSAAEQVMGFSPGLANLYHGELGIGLFLGYLSAALDLPEYRTTTYRAIEPVRRWVNARHNCLQGPGAFIGYSGYVYTLVHLGVLFNDEELMADAVSALDTVKESIADDDGLSILEGSASCVLALASVRHFLPDSQVLKIIELCAERIRSRAQPQERGVAWVENVHSGRPPLCGLSHGAAGYAAALAVSGALLGRKDYQQLARRGCEYERSLYSRKYRNWIDLRLSAANGDPENDRSVYTTAWCHGAPGIGVGRIWMSRFTEEAECRHRQLEEVRTAAETTLQEGFEANDANHSLCHGAVGNLHFARRAADELNDCALQKQAEREISRLVDVFNDQGWRCGMGPNQGLAPYQEIPGLMTGLAGIGMGALHLALPQSVPSVVLLDSPASG